MCPYAVLKLPYASSIRNRVYFTYLFSPSRYSLLFAEAHQKISETELSCVLVGREGVEPSYLAAYGPKPYVSIQLHHLPDNYKNYINFGRI